MQVGMQGDFGGQRAWNVVLGRSVCSVLYDRESQQST